MKVVSAAIIYREDSVLLARRSENQSLAGYWEFPGGKQEDDETIFQCLEREIMEELSVPLLAREIFAESIYEYANGAIKLIAITAELLSDQFELSVHDKVEMVRLDDLLSYKLAPADIPIAQRLANDKRKEAK